MIDKVMLDSRVPRRFRDRVAAHRVQAQDTPKLAGERIVEVWQSFVLQAPFERPAVDLYRATPLRNVQRHMAGSEWRAIDERAFELEAVRQRDPAGFLRGLIPPGQIVFPALRSWLVASDEIRELNGAQIQVRLELRPDVRPPYVVFRLSPHSMVANGVEIRRPTALDAAVGEHPQWSPSGLAIGTEYVDRDVPIEAVEEVLWRP